MSTLGLIPARGGSKGILRKNVREIAGKPLIAWTIEAALVTSGIDRVVVTTDDAEIAAVAERFGAEVPFLRPAELARDETPGIDPVLHAIGTLPGFSRIVLLQPTSPLRRAADIAGALALAADGDAVVSVTLASHADWIFSVDDDGRLDTGTRPATARRQDIAARYVLNGAIYVSDTATLVESRSFLRAGTRAYVMPPERSIDIDTPLEWRFADLLLSDPAT